MLSFGFSADSGASFQQNVSGDDLVNDVIGVANID